MTLTSHQRIHSPYSSHDALIPSWKMIGHCSGLQKSFLFITLCYVIIRHCRPISYVNRQDLMIGTELVPENPISNELAWLIAREDFIHFVHHESFTSYTYHTTTHTSRQSNCHVFRFTALHTRQDMTVEFCTECTQSGGARPCLFTGFTYETTHVLGLNFVLRI